MLAGQKDAKAALTDGVKKANAAIAAAVGQ